MANKVLPVIAIAGATGYIGGRLVPSLLNNGYRVRCLVRSAAKLNDRSWSAHLNLEVVQTELSDSASLIAALEGCTAVFYLVHSMMSAATKYAEQDRQLAQRLSIASMAAGVGRIIYLGGLGETGRGLSEHLASRREVETALASGGVPVTTLRAAMIIGSGSASFEILRYLVERLPIMVTPKWVTTLCQPIAVQDVIGYLVGLLSAPETAGRTFDIGGSDALRYCDIMRIMAEELGLRRRLIIPVPVLTPQLSSLWIHLITPLSKEIARPLAEGLRNPVVCREHSIKTLIHLDLLTVRSAIRVALTQVFHSGVETNWSMAGHIPGDPDWAGGKVFRDERVLIVQAPPAAVFRAVCLLGGPHGWYASDWLWTIRGWIDRMVGGPGLRRGRRHPEVVSYGEALDFWRVVGYEVDRRLTLRAEMKLPGEAQLDFEVRAGFNQDSGNTISCSLRQTALFKPRGLWGIAYWYAVLPFHGLVFSGMIRGIRKKATDMRACSPEGAQR